MQIAVCLFALLAFDDLAKENLAVSYIVDKERATVEIAIANHSHQSYEYCRKGEALQYILRQRPSGDGDWRITRWNRSGTGVDIVEIRPKEMHVWRVKLKDVELGDSFDFQFGVIAQPKGSSGSDQKNFRWGRAIDWSAELRTNDIKTIKRL